MKPWIKRPHFWTLNKPGIALASTEVMTGSPPTWSHKSMSMRRDSVDRI